MKNNDFLQSSAYSALLALALCAHPASATDTADDGLGRLFTTPEQRARAVVADHPLAKVNQDAVSKNHKNHIIIKPRATLRNLSDNVVSTSRTGRSIPPPTSPKLILQGYVKRYDNQKSTLWINGRVLTEGALIPNGQLGELAPNDQNGSWVLEVQQGSNTLKLTPQPPKNRPNGRNESQNAL